MSYEMQDFDTDVVKACEEVPVVVDFWASWCGPCKNLGPILEKLADEANGAWRLVKIDVDANPHIARSFQVQSIPYVVMLFQGRPVSAFAGALPESQIREWLDEHLPEGFEAPEPESDDAGVEELLAAGREDEAIALLEQQHVEDPEKHELTYQLARIAIYRNPEKSLKLIELIPEDAKEHFEASMLRWMAEALLRDEKDIPEHKLVRSYYLEALKHLRAREFEATLDQLLEVLYRDKAWFDEAARKLFLGVFQHLGRDHEITKGFQRRFEMALF